VASAVGLCIIWVSRIRLSKCSHKLSYVSTGVDDDVDDDDDGPDVDICGSE